jgi:flagellar hook assembly protein FlgD
MAGQLIRTLENSFKAAGQNSVTWNGMNNLGQQVPSGVYLYKIKAGGYLKIRKAVLLK